MDRQSNVIVAVFPNSSRRYHYFCKYPVRSGDHVIVDSPYNGYTCVKVVDILPQGSVKATKPVIQVVDDREYLADKEREKRIQEIKRELKRRSEKVAELLFFKHLATIDTEAASLVAEAASLVAELEKLAA